MQHGATISLEQRVEYQRRIEEVHWRHRTATQASTGQSVTPFAEAMPEAALRAKVEETLAKSAALAEFWGRPVTAGQLQAEMARMAANTRQPEVLRELWAALDHDALVIAEVLARPLLVEPQLQSWYAADERFHGALRARIAAELQKMDDVKALSGAYAERQLSRTTAAGEGTKSSSGTHAVQLSEDDWKRTLAQLEEAFGTQAGEELPVGKWSPLQENDSSFYVVQLVSREGEDVQLATVTWRKEPFDTWWQRVKQELPVAGADTALPRVNYQLPQIATPTGGAGDDQWRPTVSPLSARERHTAVWTGSEMIVWGGFFNPSPHTDYNVTVGSRYNPATDNWSLMSITNAPAWRRDHTAVWTGSEMVVWGGYAGGTGVTNTGARYNPATNVWVPLSTTSAPAPRQQHVAAWTGSKMLVWGGLLGFTDDTTTNTGGVWDAATDTWSPMSNTNAPGPRVYFTGVWTGSELIVWGGYNGSGSMLNTGGRYNPQTNMWSPTNLASAPLPRLGHAAVWTGSQMIVWGGQNSLFYNTGGIYDPSTDSWSATATAGAPSARSAIAAAWTGTEMLLWGGYDGDRLRSGARYNPSANTWQPVSSTGAPAGTALSSIVWTGSEAIVWGGQGTDAGRVNTGARYNPQSDTWVPVTNPQNGGARTEHPAVWTGVEMIVWGSYTHHSTPTDTGARYYPATDTWLPTSMANVPQYRYSPQAVWTGSQMVVWGGCSDSFCFNRLNTGGRYNPASDSWQPTSTVNAAQKRYWFSTVWTGQEMIVWGGCDAQTCGPGGNADPNGLNNGARYNPQTDTWQQLNVAGAPIGRWFQAAVWAGPEMIVWGGERGDGPQNSGGRYNPVSDSWTPTTLTNAPTARNHAYAVWTGSRMIVWGGDNSLLGVELNDGGLYNPQNDSWSATSMTNAPSPRIGHTLVWTGQEMIVWGGVFGPNNQQATSTGGRYNPQTNSWRTMSTLEAPTPRGVHSAVWTGSEMIVFGGESCARCEPVLDTGGRYAVAVPPTPVSAVSRKTHGGAGTFDVPLPLTGTPGVESRQGSGAALDGHQIVVTFPTPVAVEAVQVQSSNGAAGGTASVNGSTVTVSLSQVANAQTLQITLVNVNAAGSIANVTIPMSVLIGDVQGNGSVTSSDVSLVKGQAGAPAGGGNFRADITVDGSISATDIGVVKSRSGSGLP
ncbi:hypothetical protein BH20VER1_BH20VER1_16580 [soil metagenome]